MKLKKYNTINLAKVGFIGSLVLVAACIVTSCENDEYLYKAPLDSIWLTGDASQQAKTDSVLYSFKVYSADVKETVLNLIVRLTGKAADHDRKFNLTVVDEETNVSPNDYEIGETVLPAGAYSIVVPVKVRRNVSGFDLAKKSAKLTLSVAPSEELGVSITDRKKYSLVWCDYLIRPASWSYIEDYIGPFSQARYKFIIDFTSYTVFDDFSNDYNKILGFQGLLIKLLDKYNQDPANKNREEGWPYLNDNGDPLRFGEGLIN